MQCAGAGVLCEQGEAYDIGGYAAAFLKLHQGADIWAGR